MAKPGLVAASLAAVPAAAQPPLGADAAICRAGHPSILVNVLGFNQRTGNVRVALYGNPATFLDHGATMRKINLPVTPAGPMRICIAVPHPGRYAIAVRLRQGSRDVVKVPQGTLYPALHRLENRKLLTAEWKPSETGRNAKFYRLTAKGRAQLKAESDNWERLARADWSFDVIDTSGRAPADVAADALAWVRAARAS